MLIYLQSISCDALSLLLLLSFVSIYITKATSSSAFTHDFNNNDVRRAEEYVMTSAKIDGIKRSNVCGDGYRIEGALLKSYPYSKRETYLPYEDCYMTFQARRSSNQIRIHIITLDINDIHGGVNCLDSLCFYKSPYIRPKDKLNSVDCGQLTEAENFSVVSPTGIVTAHFSTDGGNVSGLGFKVILTAFRYPNKTHPCDPNDDEFLCGNGECISSLLLCDGVAHCLDGSDEIPNRSCTSNTGESLYNNNNNNNIDLNNRAILTKHYHWRGISIVAFLLLIFIIFTLFMAYFVFRRCVQPPIPLLNSERKNYTTIVNSPLNGPKPQIIIQNDQNRKRLDDDYNLI